MLGRFSFKSDAEGPREKLGRFPFAGEGPRDGRSSGGSFMGGSGNEGPMLAPLTAPLRMGTAVLNGGSEWPSSSEALMAPCRDLGAKRGEI